MGSSPHENRTRPGVSVVICCHNSSSRLPETLRHLFAQKVPADIPWEVLIVDNASTDDTVTTVQRCWPEPFVAPLRLIPELKRGVANARFKSFFEAQFEIISFVDDDNWVGPHWVESVSDFFSQNTDFAAVGGPSRAVFEAVPPEWFLRICKFYAIGDQHDMVGDITNEPGTLLWTAGMSLRREKALQLAGQGFRFLARSGYTTGEDTELCFALRATGCRLHYDPRFAIEHFMPASRVTWPEALRLLRIMGRTSVLLDIYLSALRWRRPYPAWKESWTFQVLKSLRRCLPLILSHPRACFFQSEGSPAALDLQVMQGRLAMLFSVAGRYEKMKEAIRNSPWARGAASRGGK